MDFASFDEMESLLYGLSKEPGFKPEKGDKSRKASPLISPSIYKTPTEDPDSRKRRNVNVKAWAGWSALDVDDYEGTMEGVLDSINYRIVCYSTASSTKEHPKFRLVFPLTEQVEADQIKAFWHALNTECLGVGDTQTKDLSRMYYVPAQYPGAYNFILSKDGPLLDPKDLAKKYPYTPPKGTSLFDQLPDHLRDRIIQERQEKLTNTDIHWSTYRDCPFVNDKLLMEYMRISETGWYHKMYQIAVSIAANAIRRGYPITPNQIAQLCKEIDADNGSWYQDRPLEREAARALEFVHGS